MYNILKQIERQKGGWLVVPSDFFFFFGLFFLNIKFIQNVLIIYYEVYDTC